MFIERDWQYLTIDQDTWDNSAYAQKWRKVVDSLPIQEQTPSTPSFDSNACETSILAIFENTPWVIAGVWVFFTALVESQNFVGVKSYLDYLLSQWTITQIQHNEVYWVFSSQWFLLN